MKVFISCPFTGLCEKENYVVKKEYQPFFNNLIDLIKRYDMDYYLAIKRENWGVDHKGPQECTLSDYNGVKDSDFLIVIPGNTISNGISGGVHIELGWASALNKKMHILLENNYNYSPVVMGLNTLCEVDYYNCDTFLDDKMLAQIENILKKEKEAKCI
jgi:hypothetical protein